MAKVFTKCADRTMLKFDKLMEQEESGNLDLLFSRFFSLFRAPIVPSLLLGGGSHDNRGGSSRFTSFWR